MTGLLHGQLFHISGEVERPAGVRARCSPHHVFRAVRQALSQVAVNVHLGQPERKKDRHSVTHGKGTPGQGLRGAFTPFPGAYHCTEARLAEGSCWVSVAGWKQGGAHTNRERPFRTLFRGQRL